MAGISFQDYEECQWKEMIVAFEGVGTSKVRGVKYAVESDDEPLHAAGDEPISIQSGNRKYTGSFKMLKGAMDDFQLAAKAAGARDVTDVKFSIQVSYLPSGSRVIMTDTLSGCKISKWEKSWDQGAKYMDIEVPINFLGLATNP